MGGGGGNTTYASNERRPGRTPAGPRVSRLRPDACRLFGPERTQRPAAARACSPGTTGSGGCCPGGRSRARHPTRTGSGSARSCCSRRRRPPSPPTLPGSWPCGRASRRWPPPISTRCSTPGRASATTPGRATCTRAPAPSPLQAAGSRRARRSCAGCPASAPIPPRRLPPSPSAGRRCRSMATWCVSSPGCMPWRSRCRRRGPRSRRGRGASRVSARAGDFAQALMDLGATVCTPRQPRCPVCPWREHCAGFATGQPETYPRKAAKKDRPVRHAAAFWIERADGAVLLRRRPAAGLLGGMMEVPSTDWRERPWSAGRSESERAGVRALGSACRRRRPHLHPLPPAGRGARRAFDVPARRRRGSGFVPTGSATTPCRR